MTSGLVAHPRKAEPASGTDASFEPERADAARIAADIEHFATLSDGRPGVTRLAYTELERDAHAYFARGLAELGLRTWQDAAGNTIGELAGTDIALPAIGTGSHLDSVVQAGRFDGIAGVCVATEVARLAVAAQIRFTHPIRFVAFAAEEGARFGQSCIGSRLAAGLLELQDLETRHDADGVTIATAMRGVGIDPAHAAGTPWAPSEWAAFLELHVEQGSVLEAGGVRIGVVDLVSGSTRLILSFTGVASHSGATPMALRADALAAAAEVVLLAERIAVDARHRGTRATVGRLDVHPGAMTTIPGHVVLTLDVRDIDSDRQRSTAFEIARRAKELCVRRGITLGAEMTGDTSPAVLPIWLRDILTGAARDAGTPYRVLTSGASHDAQVINSIAPSAIVFVPSRGGLSHVPEEWSSPADLALGADLLLEVLQRVDAELRTTPVAEA